VRVLADELGATPNSVYRAIKILQHESLLEGAQGHGIRVLDEASKQESQPLNFAFISPYEASDDFYGDIQAFLANAMAGRADHCVSRLSQRDPAKERQAITSVIQAGVQGLLIWPVRSDENADFFSDIAKQLPVVFVDRTVQDVEAPSVVLDWHDLGVQIIRNLRQNGISRALILEDPLPISSYQQMYQGMRDTLGSATGFDFAPIATTQFSTQYKSNPLASIQQAQSELAKALDGRSYQALVCPQDLYLDLVYANAPLAQVHPVGQVISITHNRPECRTLAFYQLNPTRWVGPYEQMLQRGITLLDEMVHLRSKHRRQHRLTFNACQQSASNAQIQIDPIK
jgi:DNA-binding LacI/PurR family transcriptional regulator